MIAALWMAGNRRSWDGTPSSAENRSRREALGLVRFQRKMAASEVDFFERIRRDATISEAVRAGPDPGDGVLDR